MKFYITMLTLFLASSAIAEWETEMDSLNHDLAKHKCYSTLKSKLASFNVLNKWQKNPGDGPGEFDYRSPTDRVALWVEVKSFPSRELHVKKISPLEGVEIRMTPDCQETAKYFTNDNPPKKDKNFSDADLGELVGKKDSGIIYLWSPAMPLSIEGIKLMEGFAKQHKLKLTVLADAQMSEENIQKTVAEKQLPVAYQQKFKSLDLNYRGGLNHYPAYFFYKNGKLIEFALFGLHEKEYYENQIKKFF